MNAFERIYKGKNVLITGHTGFKGSWMSIWLNSLGANVIGYALDPQDIEVAQKEIVLVKNIQESSELTVEQTNQLQAQIKLAINQVLQANGELTTEDLNDLVLSTIEHYLAEIDKDKEMTDEVIAEYVSFAERGWL